MQEPFPTVKEPKIHRPFVGAPLTLRCQPPYGYPKGIVYWGEYKAGSKLKPIENSDRVALDYEGKLKLYVSCDVLCHRLKSAWSSALAIFNVRSIQ